ncbi:hypothetical protein HRD49_00845 [Corallococcus exiguus]|uniref:hypothetical protein n=1 Tax=Corallococcus exiguus TaxID=83462 RepID=UPI001561584C|nr:hypothetical protein [Corallococcus exiguus]NRD60281.1 hypothetical protein [Corallococcus exiguus]
MNVSAIIGKAATITRNLTVEIDASTWPSGRRPSAGLLSLAGHRRINMLEVLCQVAHCTSPPVSYGFGLSEYWAFLRYLPALDADRELRLRQEWTDLDSHQKTVLSDDMGMGVTASLLRHALGLATLSPAQYVVSRASKSQLALKRSQKRGPAKSPDFVGYDAAGKICVLECKGTQTFGNLAKSMLDGVPQKSNLLVGGGLVVAESVVGGLFIPQYSSKQPAVCRFIDPEIEEAPGGKAKGGGLWQIFARSELAASLHLMGFGLEGNAVALGGRMDFTALKQRSGELNEIQEDGHQAMVRTRTVFYPRVLKTDEGDGVAGMRASIGVSMDLFELLSAGAVEKAIGLAADRAREDARWISGPVTGGFLMVTPVGMLVKLELLRLESGGGVNTKGGSRLDLGGFSRKVAVR